MQSTLTIEDGLLLSATHEIVRAVMRGKIKYEKLIVEGTKNTFKDSFLEGVAIEKFWQKLGNTVEDLHLLVRPPVILELYFTKLRELHISNQEIFDVISLQLYKKNSRCLKVLEIGANVIDYGPSHETKIDKNFLSILKICTSLTTIRLSCAIPFETAIIKEVFDFIRTEFNKRNAKSHVTHIKPLDVKATFKNGQNESETLCELQHKMTKTESVEKISFVSGSDTCDQFYKICLENFPSVTHVSGLKIHDETLLNLMSKNLKKLTKLDFECDGPVTKWPPFPKMTDITMKVLFLESFESFAKSCPKLKKLFVETCKGGTTSDCLKVARQYLIFLETLTIFKQRDEISVKINKNLKRFNLTSKLMIRNDLLLNEANEVVKAIINEDIKVSCLIVEGDRNAFDENFARSETFKSFWLKLGNSVEDLRLFVRPPVAPERYFTNLRALYLHNREIFNYVSLELYQMNCNNLEILEIRVQLIIRKDEPITINEQFSSILKHCKSLRNLRIFCEFPVAANVINEIFAGLNLEFFQMDEILFDCKTLPSWNDYENDNNNRFIYFNSLEFNFDRETSFIRITPLSVMEVLENNCEPDCSLNHHEEVKLESVQHIFFWVTHGCIPFCISCFETYPSLTSIDNLRIDDVDVLNLISEEITNLTQLEFEYRGPVIENWPPFPKLTELEMLLGSSTCEGFENFAEACPSLTKLTLVIKDGVTDGECVEIVTENLKKLEYLSIVCSKRQVLPTNMDLIGQNLKELKELQINFSESSSLDRDIQKLFGQLPKLEVIFDYFEKKFFTAFQTTKFVEDELNSELNLLPPIKDLKSFLNKNKEIHDLPPTILEHIFTLLDKRHQMTCRQVCRTWFHMFANSRKLDRTLDLRNSVLASNTNPVKLYYTSNFPYNRIVIDDKTEFFGKLGQFWEKIGEHIQEICMIGHDTDIRDIFGCGLRPHHLPKWERFTFKNITLHYVQENFYWFLFLNKLKYVDLINVKLSTDDEEKVYAVSMPHTTHLKMESLTNYVILRIMNGITFASIETLILLPLQNPKQEFDKIFETKFNFSQLTTLFIGKSSDWLGNDFHLILKHCTNLTCLGLAVTVKFKDCAAVAKEMFANLTLLCDIYFVTFENGRAQPFKTYLRTGVNSFAESKASYPLFHELQLSVLT